MLLAIFNILTGLILLSGVIGVLPGVGKHLEKFGKWLSSFQVFFGVVAIIVAVVNFNLTSIYFWSLLIGGLTLLDGIALSISSLKKYSKIVGVVQTIAGVILLVVGIIGLL